MGVNHLDYFIKMTTMKLKTLKDIFERIRELVKRDKILLALIEKIEQQEKQEAIKWVKSYYGKDYRCDGIFTKFFNITEEDLK